MSNDVEKFYRAVEMDGAYWIIGPDGTRERIEPSYRGPDMSMRIALLMNRARHRAASPVRIAQEST